jgi:hypothetical protein
MLQLSNGAPRSLIKGVVSFITRVPSLLMASRKLARGRRPVAHRWTAHLSSKAKKTRQMKRILALTIAATFVCVGPTQAQIVINEINSDSFNTPTTDYFEFIELYSLTGTTTALDGLTLVLFNGGNGNAAADVSYRVLDLDGFSTDANGYFVIGTPSVLGADETNFLLGPGPTFTPGNIIQNGQDAIALYLGDATAFPNGTAPTTLNLVDAIVYGTDDADDTILLAALGETIQFNEGPNPSSDAADRSLSRFTDGTGDFMLSTPTPGAVNVPEPTSVALLGLGAMAGLVRRRR